MAHPVVSCLCQLMNFLGFGTVCCPSAPHVCSYSLASMLPGWDWLLLSGLCWLSAGCPGISGDLPACFLLRMLVSTTLWSSLGLDIWGFCAHVVLITHPVWWEPHEPSPPAEPSLLGVWVSSQHKRPHCLSLLLLIIAWVFCFWVSLWCILLSLKGIGISLIAYWGRSNSHVYKGRRGRE